MRTSAAECTIRAASGNPGQATINGLFRPSVQFMGLLHELPLPILLLDTDRRLAAMNRAAEALCGLSMEDALGLPCRHVVRSNLCHMRCPLEDLKADSEPLCLEGDLINRERQKIPVRFTFAPVLDADGRLAGYMESVEDLRPLLGHRAAGQPFSFGDIIGNSPKMEKVFAILPGIAQSDSSVMITGETGTGKDLVAEALHQASGRAKGPFVKVNCGALPEALLESELFGHEKGAFTGAVSSKPGRFRLAHNGTLFLTEVGDLPLSLQVKLLTFLDDRVIHPLGSTKGVSVDVRLVAATHRDLEAMVRQGTFREDLLFRLNVVRLHLPPLRERGHDIRLLLDHFLRLHAEHLGKNFVGFSEKALARLLSYPYPGNVRELKNIVEFASNVCSDEKVGDSHLPTYLEDERPILVDTMSQMPAVVEPAPSYGYRPGAAPPPESWPDVEKRMILDALVQAGGRKKQAAAILGWGRSTLWRKMKHYGLDG